MSDVHLKRKLTPDGYNEKAGVASYHIMIYTVHEPIGVSIIIWTSNLVNFIRKLLPWIFICLTLEVTALKIFWLYNRLFIKWHDLL